MDKQFIVLIYKLNVWLNCEATCQCRQKAAGFQVLVFDDPGSGNRSMREALIDRIYESAFILDQWPGALEDLAYSVKLAPVCVATTIRDAGSMI